MKSNNSPKIIQIKTGFGKMTPIPKNTSAPKVIVPKQLTPTPSPVIIPQTPSDQKRGKTTAIPSKPIIVKPNK